jgi:hypothetical protein
MSFFKQIASPVVGQCDLTHKIIATADDVTESIANYLSVPVISKMNEKCFKYI